ncbi:uncharacterized protein LOC127288367 isoform X1 [Leptopilina boulardi]|uniref:uncharacterized protein LOC127288367 isoform X1 n=1 Tax=Leptopilina boulardi TaxID=63433 RepID=UPI0021F53014|nr:uncharacterized protein LOC127288367 isoform X1 [Leptopilina boulardi]
MNLTIRKVFFFISIFAAINIIDGFIRTVTPIYANFMTKHDPEGVSVTRINKTTTEIVFTEEFNADTNPLKVHIDYFFETSGERHIIQIDNLCAPQKNDTTEYAAQTYVLKYFGNTDKCPIKKGTKVTHTIGKPFTCNLTDPDCGSDDGTISMFKKNSKKGNSPLVLLVHYGAKVTGSDC